MIVTHQKASPFFQSSLSSRLCLISLQILLTLRGTSYRFPAFPSALDALPNLFNLDIPPELDVVRCKRDRRKGHTTRFVQSQTIMKNSATIATIESFNGVASEEVGITSLETGGRWKILDFRTSTTPFIPKLPYLEKPSAKFMNRHYKKLNGWGHWLWNRGGKTLSWSCTCNSHHRAIPCGRHGRKKPEFLKEKGLCSMVPEYAVVPESEIEETLNITFPSDPAPELSPESKRYLQHIIRQYEVRKAASEAQIGKSGRTLLNSSSSDALTISVDSKDYSLMKSRDIPLPESPMWVVVFEESYEVDHGISSICANLMITKLSNFDIPYILVKISPKAYGAYTGFLSLGVFSSYYVASKRCDREDSERSTRKKQRFETPVSDFRLSAQ